jgi:hypothetical protein
VHTRQGIPSCLRPWRLRVGGPSPGDAGARRADRLLE